MQIVEGIFSDEFEIKKSLFISYICPISSRLELNSHLQNEHAKATHIVWAYRELREFGQIAENQTDNGEPKNSAGMPMLNVLRGREIVDSCVFAVRYFGGIKLGVGGLIRAYSTAANLAINAANFREFTRTTKVKFFVPFSLLPRFEHFFKTQSIKTARNFINSGCEISTDLSQTQLNLFCEFAREFAGGGFKWL